MEAGAFHALGGRPAELRISDVPWNIAVVQGPDAAVSTAIAGEAVARMPEDALTVLHDALSFHYAHVPATLTPSKQTATGRKGRLKDEEAAEAINRGFIPVKVDREERPDVDAVYMAACLAN